MVGEKALHEEHNRLLTLFNETQIDKRPLVSILAIQPAGNHFEWLRLRLGSTVGIVYVERGIRIKQFRL